MIGTSGVFQSVPCPDPQCKRPYCHFSHSDVASSSQAFPTSVTPFPTSYPSLSGDLPSGASVEITQESGDMYGSSYTGYYSASYTPGYNSYSAYAPVAPNYEVGSTYYETNTDSNKKESKPAQEDSSRKRRRTSSEDSSKPKLPPDLGNDPLLTSLEKNKKKETVTVVPVSKKAKRIPVTANIVEAKAKNKGKTEEFNQCVQKITEIDRKLAELKKLTEKPKVPDIDSLFEVDDEPPPRPVTQKSSSTSSTDSLKQSKLQFQKIKPISNPPDDDVVVIESKPAPVSKTPSSTSIPTKNQRIAHVPTFPVKPKGPPLPSPMVRRQTLAEQLAKRREAAAAMKKQSAEEQKKLEETIKNNTMGKVRIAHVPKAPLPVKVDSKILPPSRPEPLDSKAKKFSISLRKKTLQKLIDEFMKFMSPNDAIASAQKEEHELMQKATAQSGYLSGMTGVLRRIKEMNGTIKPVSFKNKVSHLDVLKGKHGASISLGVNSGFKKNADRVKELSEAELYEELFDKYLLSDQELENNGYPLWADEIERNVVKIKLRDNESFDKVFVDSKNPFRTCCRCNKKFRIKIQEDDVIEEDDCIYHWGKLWRKKEHATWVSRYTCCGGDGQAEGCCLAKYHVTQMYQKSFLAEFVEAPSRRQGFDDRSTRIVALDCEMVYTTMGYSVARLSVVNYKGEKIMDELIKPPGEILDTNYRFSGLKLEDFDNVKLDLTGAQERFFELVNRDSILVGHSLESDLKAMRIVHKNVVDTSILYPHKQGPPFKRALKNLSSEVLMKIIQEDVTGHDSAEDAQITLELMERIRKFGTTIYTHKKKFIFACLVATYGVNYARSAVRDGEIRTYYARQAIKYGEQTISPEISPRKITVLINKSANSGSGVSDFQKNALPLLHLAGIAVTVIKVENAEQMRALCSVLDQTEADGIMVVGGDGTVSDVLTGLAQRKDELPSLPVGIFPGGKCNKSLRLLVPTVFRQTSDVRYQCESAMAVIENSVRSVKPMKVEITSLVEPEEKKEESAEEKPEELPSEEAKVTETEIANTGDSQTWKVETIYTIGDISDGWFSYIDEKKWKFWYWGSWKRRFAYVWEMLKNSPKEIRAEIELTDYCSGCNKCRTTKVQPPPVWRWWHILTGSPKSQRPNQKEKNYSQVVNEGCGRKTEMCAQGTDIVIVGEQHEDACSLRLRVGGTFAGRLGIMSNGWARASEDFIISSATPGFYGTDLVASSISMKLIECPKALEKLFVSGEIKDFKVETSTVRVQPVEKSVELFLPKHTRVNLDAF